MVATLLCPEHPYEKQDRPPQDRVAKCRAWFDLCRCVSIAWRSDRMAKRLEGLTKFHGSPPPVGLFHWTTEPTGTLCSDLSKLLALVCAISAISCQVAVGVAEWPFGSHPILQKLHRLLFAIGRHPEHPSSVRHKFAYPDLGS